MIFVKLVLDNKFAIDITPENFVRHYYLQSLAIEDLVDIEVGQGEMSDYSCKGCKFEDFLGTNDESHICDTCARISDLKDNYYAKDFKNEKAKEEYLKVYGAV
jgi:hypothetical protein